MWLSALDEHSILFIVLNEWVPPLLTIFVGGMFASILIPRWQDAHARSHAREARRLALAEEASQRFMRYVAAWARLRGIAALEVSKPEGLTEPEFQRKQSYVTSRDESRIALLDTLCSAQVYFDRNTHNVIETFFEWDAEQIVKRLPDLPNLNEWRRHQAEVLGKMRSDVLR